LGNMASAARRAPAASSAASSTVSFGSWPITDITILIMTCRRRIFRASSVASMEASTRFGFSIVPRAGLSGRNLRPALLDVMPGAGDAVLWALFSRPVGAGATASGRCPSVTAQAGDRRRRYNQGGGIMPEPAGSSSGADKPQPNPDEKLVRVFDTEQETEALVVRGLLESAGIDSDITSLDAQQDILPGVGGTIILVREEDAAKARDLIESYRRVPGSDDPTEA